MSTSVAMIVWAPRGSSSVQDHRQRIRLAADRATGAPDLELLPLPKAAAVTSASSAVPWNRSGCRKNSLTLIVSVSRTSSSSFLSAAIAFSNAGHASSLRRVIMLASRRFIWGSLYWSQGHTDGLFEALTEREPLWVSAGRRRSSLTPRRGNCRRPAPRRSFSIGDLRGVFRPFERHARHAVDHASRLVLDEHAAARLLRSWPRPRRRPCPCR